MYCGLRNVEEDWRSHDERSADYMGIIILLRMLYLDAGHVTLKKGKFEVKTHVEVVIMPSLARGCLVYISHGWAVMSHPRGLGWSFDVQPSGTPMT